MNNNEQNLWWWWCWMTPESGVSVLRLGELFVLSTLLPPPLPPSLRSSVALLDFCLLPFRLWRLLSSGPPLSAHDIYNVILLTTRTYWWSYLLHYLIRNWKIFFSNKKNCFYLFNLMGLNDSITTSVREWRRDVFTQSLQGCNLYWL